MSITSAKCGRVECLDREWDSFLPPVVARLSFSTGSGSHYWLNIPALQDKEEGRTQSPVPPYLKSRFVMGWGSVPKVPMDYSERGTMQGVSSSVLFRVDPAVCMACTKTRPTERPQNLHSRTDRARLRFFRRPMSGSSAPSTWNNLRPRNLPGHGMFFRKKALTLPDLNHAES